MEKIGLIAGNRKFPLLFAQKAKEKGYQVVAIAIKNETSFRIKNYAQSVHWLKLEEFKKIPVIFQQEGVNKVAMAGQINPRHLFNKKLFANEDIRVLLGEVRDRRADTIFGAVAQILREQGLELLDSTLFLEDFLPKKGPITHLEPDFEQWQDIYFGVDIAKEMGYLDIGQTVAVKDKAIVAVEALEGTDSLIRRAGRMTKCGVIIVKVSKPKQDMRFDIPVVGLRTIRNLVAARASCLAIEAEKTLFIDKEESVRLADSKRLAIVAV